MKADFYTRLMTKAKARGWSKKTAPCYAEVHHVVPRSMGGSNDPINLVVLTAREHYIAHALLYRLYKTPEMAYAWFCMTWGTDRRLAYTSKSFERARKAAAWANSKSMMGTKNPMFGRVGEKYPRFSGWYVTPAGLFASCVAAAEPNSVGKSTVQRRCKNPDYINKAPRLGLAMMNKSWKELGWDFKERT